MNADHRAYWIWMQQVFEAGSPKPAEIDKQYPGGVREFLESGPKLWFSRHRFSEKEIVALQSFSLAEAQARLEYAEKMGWKVITPDTSGYPEALKNIYDPPAVLYIKGKLPNLNKSVNVAVAGARKASESSADAARSFGYSLALGGACVISGGALGIDAAVLSGALEIPGAKVISVLPVSLDSTYVRKNARLRNRILERGGALMSEHFSQQLPAFNGFHLRNRLITGMSRGVVLIQAAEKSGTMLYSKLALEQNRDVFVYPGDPGDPDFAGSRALMADGAPAVETGNDILREYDKELAAGLNALQARSASLFDPGHIRTEPERPPAEKTETPVKGHLPGALADLSPGAEGVWQALETTPLSVADLESRTQLPTARLLAILTELELEGLAESHPGKRFTKAWG